MQDLSKKIKFLRLRKKVWRSFPYRLYVNLYDSFLKLILRFNKKNITVIFINGMRRSGNHYLMKTLMDSANSNVIYYNNQSKLNDITIKNGVQTKFRASKNILVIIGYEDLFLKDFDSSCISLMNLRFNALKYIKLVITRDVRNIMASRLNHAHMASALRTKRNSIAHTRILWADHHNVESCSYSVRYEHLVNDTAIIDLEPFFIRELKESKKILNRYGGGSSFENNNFMTRYAKFAGDKIFESLIKDFKDIDERVHGRW